MGRQWVLKSQVYGSDRTEENWLKQEQDTLASFLSSRSFLLLLLFVRFPKRSTQLPVSDKASTCTISSSCGERDRKSNSKLEKQESRPFVSYRFVRRVVLYSTLVKYVSKLGCHHFCPFSLSCGMLRRGTSILGSFPQHRDAE